jgi:hypothetical protein
MTINEGDYEALVWMFNERLQAESETTRAYWAGYIDSHCAQNAIGLPQLKELAANEGFQIDWPCRVLSGAWALRDEGSL